MRTGAVVSTTVIVCEAVCTFEHESVAVQVLVVATEHDVVTITSLELTLVEESQLSAAVTTGKVGGVANGPLHSIVLSVSTPDRTGLVVSETVIVEEEVAVFEHASETVQVLSTENWLGQVPAVSTSRTVAVRSPSQLSFAWRCSAAGISDRHWTGLYEGAEEANTGRRISATMTPWVRSLKLPQVSEALHLLPRAYRLGHDPETLV